MKYKNIVIFFACLNIACTCIAYALPETYSMPAYDVMESTLNDTTNAGNAALGGNTTGQVSTSWGFFELLTQSKGILSTLTKTFYGFPWLLNAAFGGFLPITFLAGGLAIIQTFMFFYLLTNYRNSPFDLFYFQ